jgi:hypothetical protein
LKSCKKKNLIKLTKLCQKKKGRRRNITWCRGCNRVEDGVREEENKGLRWVQREKYKGKREDESFCWFVEKLGIVVF